MIRDVAFVLALSVAVCCRLLTRINWAATFCLLGVEGGKAAYKKFIHTDLVSAVNSGKMHLYKHLTCTQLQVTTAYIRKTVQKSISEIIHGILQEE